MPDDETPQLPRSNDADSYPQPNPNSPQQPTEPIPTQPQANLGNNPLNYPTGYPQTNPGGYPQNYPGGGYPPNYPGNYPGVAYPPNMPAGVYQMAPAKKNGLAITAMVLGIVALLLSWIPLLNYVMFLSGVVGLGLGITAIVLAKRNPNTLGGFGMALTGIVTSVLAIIVVLLFHFWLVGLINEAQEEENTPTATTTTTDEETAGADDETTGPLEEETTDTDDDLFSYDGELPFSIEFVSLATIGPDVKGDPTAMLTMNVTNTSDRQLNTTEILVAASQDGELLSTAVYSKIPETYDPESYYENTIAPGDTETVTIAYLLENLTSNVTFEVSDLYSVGAEPITQVFKW